jgi:hypothetical protein
MWRAPAAIIYPPSVAPAHTAKQDIAEKTALIQRALTILKVVWPLKRRSITPPSFHRAQAAGSPLLCVMHRIMPAGLRFIDTGRIIPPLTRHDFFVMAGFDSRE